MPQPFERLVGSRKFWLAAFAVVQALVFNYLDVPDDVWQSIVALVGILIASIAYENAAGYDPAPGPVEPERTGPDRVG